MKTEEVHWPRLQRAGVKETVRFSVPDAPRVCCKHRLAYGEGGASCGCPACETFRGVSSNDTLYALWGRGAGRRSRGCGMPTVALEGQFRFVVNTRENAFEPPHVHVWVGNEDVCRVELNGGAYMDQPPPGNFRGHHAGLRETRYGDQGNVGRHPQEVGNGRGSGEKRQPDDDHRQPVG